MYWHNISHITPYKVYISAILMLKTSERLQEIDQMQDYYMGDQ